jgi:two-component system sensor histidine kinase ChvG
VTNLIDNAASFSPEGGKVVARLRTIGTEVEIAIEDEGPGMPDDKLEKVFERFYSDRPQSDGTIGKNSGLGLSISREIIAAHGGRIWAENRREATPDGTPAGPVLGARFVVRLPAAAEPWLARQEIRA